MRHLDRTPRDGWVDNAALEAATAAAASTIRTWDDSVRSFRNRTHLWKFFLALAAMLCFCDATFGQSAESEGFTETLQAAKDAFSNRRSEEGVRLLLAAKKMARERQWIAWLHDVAVVYDQNNFKKLAKELYIEAQRAGESAPFSEDSDWTVSLLLNLAHNLGEHGALEEAEAVLRQAHRVDASGNRQQEIDSKWQLIQQRAAKSGTTRASPPPATASASHDAHRTSPPPPNDIQRRDDVREQSRDPRPSPAPTRQQSLGPFRKTLGMPEVGELVRSHCARSTIPDRNGTIERAASDLPGAIGLGIVEALIHEVLDQGLRAQQARLDAIARMRDYLRDLRDFLPDPPTQSCRDFEVEASGNRADELDRAVAAVTSGFEEAARLSEGALVGVEARSSLETLSAPSGDREGSRSRPTDAAASFNATQPPIGRHDRFRLDRLDLQQRHSPILGKPSDQRDLTKLVGDALESSTRRRDGTSARARLTQETEQVKRLGSALYEVRLLHQALDQRRTLLLSEALIQAEADRIRQCARTLRGASSIKGGQVENARSVRAELAKIVDETEEVHTQPSLVTALARWEGQFPHPLDDQSIDQALHDQLRQMSYELRTQIRLRRTIWCQTKRQADLAARLGPQ